jgi:hypothetical protein
MLETGLDSLASPEPARGAEGGSGKGRLRGCLIISESFRNFLPVWERIRHSSLSVKHVVISSSHFSPFRRCLLGAPLLELSK